MRLNQHAINVPDGEYDAIWSAYELIVKDDSGKSIEVKCNIGCKGINCPVKVKIENNHIVNWRNEN